MIFLFKLFTTLSIASIGLPGLIVMASHSHDVFDKQQNSLCFVNGKPEKYNNYQQICCNNKIQIRLKDQNCCDTKEFYFNNRSLCCGSKLFDRFVVDCKNNKDDCSPHCSPNDAHCSEQICCGTEAVIKSEAMCCHGNKIYLTQQQKTDHDFLSCCNETHLYDVRSEICCDKRVFQLNRDTSSVCCADRTVSLKENTCLRTINSSGAVQFTIGNLYEAVCGNNIYNRQKHGCCNGVVYPEPEMVALDNIWRPNPNFQCCDNLFLNQGEKCCREHHAHYFKTHTIPNQPELDCCGAGFYNTSKELCNNGTLVPKQPNKERCGLGFEYYDPAREGCCGFNVYSKDEFKCCQGNVISNERQCCNGEGIDSSYICCSGRSAKKTYFDSDECCFSYDNSKAEAYSKERGERCVDGNVAGGYLPDTEPCGNKNYFDPRNQICCNGEAHNASWGCCDEQAYDKFKQTCCFNELFDLKTSDSSCCDIDGIAYRHNDPINPCLAPCGSTYFDSNKEVCCQNKVYRYKRDFECCGETYININRNSCCGDQAFKKRGNMKCCGGRALYNSKSAFCNSDGMIVSYYSSKLCKPRILYSFQKTKANSCNSTYGVSGLIEKVSVKNTKHWDTNTLSIKLKVRKWLGGSRSQLFNMKANGWSLALSIYIHQADSPKCAQHLKPKSKVMIFFDNEPIENKVTIPKVAKVFLFGYTAEREQYMLSCRSKV